jgi:hypothetical protein
MQAAWINRLIFNKRFGITATPEVLVLMGDDMGSLRSKGLREA